MQDKAWREKNLGKVVIYYHKILRDIEKSPEIRRFALVPLHSIGRKFVSIDKTVLYGILCNAGVINKETKIKDFMKESDEYYKSTFQGYEKLAPKGFSFSGTIQTDGVSMCIHYKKIGSQKTKYSRNVISSCPLPVTKRQRVTNSVFPLPVLESPDMIGIDPGKSNIVYAVRKNSEGDHVGTHILTRQDYYMKSGINWANCKCQKWHNKIKAKWDIHNRYNIKTTSAEQFLLYL